MLAITFPQSVDSQALLKEAENDTVLSEIKKKLMLNGLGKPGYEIRENRLWFKQRLAIPKTSKYIPVLISECHSELNGSHAGILKTIKKNSNNSCTGKV